MAHLVGGVKELMESLTKFLQSSILDINRSIKTECKTLYHIIYTSYFSLPS
jgi:hypothetical protein